MCEPPPPVNPKTSAQLCGYETGTNVFLTFNTEIFNVQNTTIIPLC